MPSLFCDVRAKQPGGPEYLRTVATPTVVEQGFSPRVPSVLTLPSGKWRTLKTNYICTLFIFVYNAF